MNGFEIAGGILLIITSILIIAVVIMQEGGKGGIEALGGSSDSYLGKNSGRTLDAMLVKVTKVLTVAFFVITLVTNLIGAIVK